MAKTGVSTTGTTAIVGDIGLSPAAATYITGFDLIMDSSGMYSTSALVTGNIYASDYTSPTPSNLTVSIGAMETAYSDAAGRPDPDFTELYTGDITGQTLVPGLYKWSTGVLISAAGFTISGGTDDVWIFQIAQNLTVAEGAIITLSGGAQPGNIFWQIAGETTIGTTAQFNGIVLCQTLISLNTGASINGRLLAQTAVTLDANNVVESSSTTAIIEGDTSFVVPENSLSNYPNPFNPETTISFTISREFNENTELGIYNMKGQKIKSFNLEQFSTGMHSLVWNGEDDGGSNVSSGIYFYKLSSGT
jgi:hypothetical protein